MAIDPRLSVWLHEKNLAARTFLDAVQNKARVISEAHADRTLETCMDGDLAIITDVLKFSEAIYGLTPEAREEADRISRTYLDTLSPDESQAWFKKRERLTRIFNEAHNFHEAKLHYLAFSMPDGSIDFAAVSTAIDMDTATEKPDKKLHYFKRPLHISDAARLEWVTNDPSLVRDTQTAIHIYTDMPENGIVIRNVKLEAGTDYHAYFFYGYGADGCDIRLDKPNTRPAIGPRYGVRT